MATIRPFIHYRYVTDYRWIQKLSKRFLLKFSRAFISVGINTPSVFYPSIINANYIFDKITFKFFSLLNIRVIIFHVYNLNRLGLNYFDVRSTIVVNSSPSFWERGLISVALSHYGLGGVLSRILSVQVTKLFTWQDFSSGKQRQDDIKGFPTGTETVLEFSVSLALIRLYNKRLCERQEPR